MIFNSKIKIGVIAAIIALSGFLVSFHPTSASAFVNLVPNPSLETASTTQPTLPLSWRKGGWGTNTRVLTYPVAGYTGAKAVKTEITSYTNGDAKWYFYPVPVVAGEQYEFSDYYMSDTVSRVTLQLQMADGSYKYPDIGILPASPNWQNFRQTFTVPANVAGLTVFHLIKSVGYVTVDDYSLTQIDSVPPSVSITEPADGQTVYGSLNISAAATDNDSTSEVRFFIDGNQVGQNSVAPYSYLWDTTSYSDGLHAIIASARDGSGNTATSSIVSVIVYNGSSTPLTGKITVIKNVVNDNGGVKQPSDFPLFVDGHLALNGATNDFAVGNHSISETNDSNYSAFFSGDCDSRGIVVLNNGEQKTCVITNDDIDPNPNLVPNPSFEIASTTQPTLPLSWRKGGWGTNTRVLTYPVAGYTGAKAVKTEITSYTNGDAKWYFYPVPVVAGEQYEFSDYYMSDTQSYVTVQIQMTDGTNKYIDIARADPSQAWKSVYGTFVAPQGAVSATVFHLIKGVGYLTVDDYNIKKIIPDPDNLIYNSSLEITRDGTSPDGWKTNKYGTNQASFSYPSGNALLGQRTIKTEIINYVSGDAKWYFNPITVNGGEEYLFSDYFISNIPSYTAVEFRMANGSYSYLGMMNLASTSIWKKTESPLIVPEGAVSMSIFHLIKGVGYLITDNYSLKRIPSGKFSEGMVTLDFDDGFYSVYQNALPILNAAGIKSSQYIVSGFLTDSFYVNPEETLNMFNSGHEIGSHTINHIRLTPLSDAEMRNEVFGSKNELENIGLAAIKTFVYPFGDFNDVVRQAVIDAGYVGARSVYAGYNTKNSDRFSLKDQHVESDTTVEQVKSYIDRALIDKTWLILEFHATDYSGDRYSNTPETLQAIADYLVLKRAKVVTTEEGIALMSQ